MHKLYRAYLHNRICISTKASLVANINYTDILDESKLLSLLNKSKFAIISINYSVVESNSSIKKIADTFSSYVQVSPHENDTTRHNVIKLVCHKSASVKFSFFSCIAEQKEM